MSLKIIGKKGMSKNALTILKHREDKCVKGTAYSLGKTNVPINLEILL